MDALAHTAHENLRRLAANPYPGRGLVLGRSADGHHLLQCYWIMGRSENSRNRRFVAEGATLRTEAVDPARLRDPSLVIYTAMREAEGHFLVSNGDHTDELHAAVTRGESYAQGLRRCRHEPDAPNHTPRIAGALNLRDPEAPAWLGIVKAHPADAERSVRQFFEYDLLPPGLGWCLTTYRGDGDPLPAFAGEPEALALEGTPEALLETLWEALNAENRVALAVKRIDPASGASHLLLRNQYA